MLNSIRKRPWLLVVAAMTAFVAVNLTMLVIALRNPPVLLP